MKRKILIILLAVVLLAAVFVVGRASAAASCFTDTYLHWAEIYICWLKSNNISTGYPDGSFQPENYIKRGEMAKLIRLQAEIPPTSGNFQLVVGPGDWVRNSTSTNGEIIYYSNALRVSACSRP